MPIPTAGAANNEPPASNARANSFLLRNCGFMVSLLIGETMRAMAGVRVSSSVNSLTNLHKCSAVAGDKIARPTRQRSRNQTVERRSFLSGDRPVPDPPL
jgi:hypothetical protein